VCTCLSSPFSASSSVLSWICFASIRPVGKLGDDTKEYYSRWDAKLKSLAWILRFNRMVRNGVSSSDHDASASLYKANALKAILLEESSRINLEDGLDAT
jgi:hypothetical protein